MRDLCYCAAQPTAGLDPASRRAVWQLLQSFRQQHVVILITHYMDEAENIGDRIILLSHGRLRCIGSPLFLKSHFGCGYHLIIELPNGQLIHKIKELAPSAVVESTTANEIAFTLPLAASAVLPALLQLLEVSTTSGSAASVAASSTSAKSFGLSCTSLDEVFLRLADEAHEQQPPQQQSSQAETIETSRSVAAARAEESKDYVAIDQATLSAHAASSATVSKPSFFTQLFAMMFNNRLLVARYVRSLRAVCFLLSVHITLLPLFSPPCLQTRLSGVVVSATAAGHLSHSGDASADFIGQFHCRFSPRTASRAFFTNSAISSDCVSSFAVHRFAFCMILFWSFAFQHSTAAFA